MGVPRLSLCMITRNEAENIDRCLESVREFVDEIVVVDTGSVDDTTAVAAGYGAKVITTVWQDDFAAARNLSLAHATGDWILFLDADEELALESGPALTRLVRAGDKEAYFVLITNLLPGGAELTAPSIRLFRNRKNYRFRGRLHEQIVDSILAYAGQQQIGQAPIRILHHGYNPATFNIQAKIRRNLAILERYPPAERDGFFFYNLGTEYLRLGRWKEALANYREALRLTHPAKIYGPILVKRTINALMALRQFREAISHLRYYQTLYPDFRDLVFLEALCHLETGRYTEALECLRRYGVLPPPPTWYPVEKWPEPPETLAARIRPLVRRSEYPPLSVCIIGRDEASCLGACIKSVAEIAAEIIFIDTGSTDQTPCLAYQLGAKVHRTSWQNNFATARNLALAAATSEWILVLDADEVLQEASRNALPELLKVADRDAYLLPICTFLDRRLSLLNCFVKGSCRLFRNKNYRYQDAVAETILPAVKTAGGTVGCAPITIDHLHFLRPEKEIARRQAWKIAAIREHLTSAPAEQYSALGREFFYARDFTAATQCLGEAYQMLAQNAPPDIFALYALALINTGNCAQAIAVLTEGAAVYPDYTDLLYLLAIAYLQHGDSGTAEQFFHRCLVLGDAPWEKYPVTPGAGSYKVLLSLGPLYARTGRTKEAIATLLEAARHPAAFEPAVKSLTILRKELGVPLDRFLSEKGLCNTRSLSIVAETLAGTGQFAESLHYLLLASKESEKEPPPGDFTPLLQAMETLRKAFWHHFRLVGN